MQHSWTLAEVYRPADHDDIVYLTLLKRSKGDTWYSKVPIGHNMLSKMVSHLCSDAGILGFKTNHSLRVTSATRLFHSGADKQLIMSHTRHRSVDGVRTYKRESQEQKRSLSNVLNAASNGQPTKKPKLDLIDTEKRGHAVDQPLQHSTCMQVHTLLLPLQSASTLQAALPSLSTM